MYVHVKIHVFNNMLGYQLVLDNICTNVKQVFFGIQVHIKNIYSKMITQWW